MSVLRCAAALVFFGFHAVPSLAAPVYLDCNVAGDSEQKKFAVKLDEATGQVTHTSDDGTAFNTNGFFAPNTVSYQNIVISSDIKVTFQYEIDRTSLKVKETFIAEPADPKYARVLPPRTTTMVGKCKVVKVSGRKI